MAQIYPQCIWLRSRVDIFSILSRKWYITFWCEFSHRKNGFDRNRVSLQWQSNWIESNIFFVDFRHLIVIVRLSHVTHFPCEVVSNHEIDWILLLKKTITLIPSIAQREWTLSGKRKLRALSKTSNFGWEHMNNQCKSIPCATTAPKRAAIEKPPPWEEVLFIGRFRFSCWDPEENPVAADTKQLRDVWKPVESLFSQ